MRADYAAFGVATHSLLPLTGADHKRGQAMLVRCLLLPPPSPLMCRQTRAELAARPQWREQLALMLARGAKAELQVRSRDGERASVALTTQRRR